MIVDYHMHLRAPDESLDHTVEGVERFVEAAAARGLDEIGFTEHVYYFAQTRSLWTLPSQLKRCTHDIERYVDAVTEAKRRGMAVKLGIEVDYLPGREEETAALLAPYPWDYVLGSIHYIGDAGIDGEPTLIAEVGVEEAWRRYYETLASAGSSGLFDSLAHTDLLRMYGPEIPWDWDSVAGSLDGVCLEVSSGVSTSRTPSCTPIPSFCAKLARAARPSRLPRTLMSPRTSVAISTGRSTMRARRATRP